MEAARAHTAWDERTRAWLSMARERTANALPAILLFVVSFAVISALFGTYYMMSVSSAVCIFQTRRRRENSFAMCVAIVALNMLLTALAYVATLGLGWCILLNATVPFLLVLAQSNQFMPKGYFGFAMVFVFMELRPMAPAQFVVQVQAELTASLLLVAAIALWQLWQRRAHDPDVTETSLETFAELLDRLADGERGEALTRDALALERTFDRLRIMRQHFFRTTDRREITYSMYALLFQRAVYLLADDERDDEGDGGRIAADDRPRELRALAHLIRLANADPSPENHALLAHMAQAMLNNVQLPEGRLRIFFRSFLHMFIRILHRQGANAESGRRIRLQKIPWREVAHGLWLRINRDTFEFRFACRLSIVLAISCPISLLWNFEHTYWFPMNAFLLLMPSFEESTRRMRSRPLGTAVACIVAPLVAHALPGVLPLFAVSLACISIMYCCSPGSWVQAIFATTFALLMASLTMDTVTAAGLRLLFVLMAVALALLVNGLVMPSRKRRIFEGNSREMRRIVRRYWTVVQRAAAGGADTLDAAAELLAYFHLVYAEAMGFVKKMEPGEARERARGQLLTSWQLFSEVEQVECLVLTEPLSASDRQAVARAAGILSRRKAPTEALGELERILEGIESCDVAYALSRYCENARLIG